MRVSKRPYGVSGPLSTHTEVKLRSGTSLESIKSQVEILSVAGCQLKVVGVGDGRDLGILDRYGSSQALGAGQDTCIVWDNRAIERQTTSVERGKNNLRG